MTHVLIIDDSPTEVHVFRQMLMNNDIEVSVAKNGEEGIEKAIEIKPDCILMDVVMPGKNGFEVLQELHYINLDIRVIVLTAHADVKSAIEAANLGASDFISKPYDFDELLITIRKTVQREI